MASERGFTLMEVLVALAVLGALSLALAQGVQFGLLAWRIQSRMIADQGDLDAVVRTLAKLIEGLEPGGPARPPTVKGDAHSFSFTARLPIATTRPPLREADVTLLVDGDGRLSVLWLPHIRNWLGPPRTPGRSTLLEGVRELDIAYWHQDQEATGSWVDVWTGPGVPRLVRFRIVPQARQGGAAWPDIMVAPMRDRFQL